MDSAKQSDGIILKTVTAVSIRRARGILKHKPGQKPLAEEWAAYKKEEHELEKKRAS